MGTNNRQRRAAKARAKARAKEPGRRQGQAQGRPAWGAGSGSEAGWLPFEDQPRFDPPLVQALLFEAARARLQGRNIVSVLDRLARLPASLVDQIVEAALLDQVDAAWQAGWQPSELLRQAKRGRATAAAARLVSHAIAADHAERRADTLDPRWITQVEGLDLPPADGRTGWASRWAAAEGLDRRALVDAATDALATLLLPRIEVLLPPPSEHHQGPGGGARTRTVGPPPSTGGQADPVLERVRNLLAKAESSTFEAEATAFTAKAQELMTRHAIDAALLQRGAHAQGEQPVTIRVPIDNPYISAKSLLLQTVAHRGRCRAVFLGSIAMSTVIGFADDVAAVELLFTSLLLQAQRALSDAARSAPPGTRTRSQSYRSAFLLSYTQRIDDRLGEINDAVYADVEAKQGGSFLPALRSRAEQIDAEVAERFGKLATSTVRGGYDSAGWAHGRHAADQARLTGDALPAT